jgi:hypothetical protein
LLLIGQQGLGHFFRSFPIGWKTVQIVRQRRRKMTNTALTNLNAIQAASQSTFANANSHLPEEICQWICKFGGTSKKDYKTKFNQA